jgi:hypothetical protein
MSCQACRLTLTFHINLDVGCAIRKVEILSITTPSLQNNITFQGGDSYAGHEKGPIWWIASSKARVLVRNGICYFAQHAAGAHFSCFIFPHMMACAHCSSTRGLTNVQKCVLHVGLEDFFALRFQHYKQWLYGGLFFGKCTLNYVSLRKCTFFVISSTWLSTFLEDSPENAQMLLNNSFRNQLLEEQNTFLG